MSGQTIEAGVDRLRAVEYKHADDAVNASVAAIECGTVVNTWHDGSLVFTTINLTKVLRGQSTAVSQRSAVGSAPPVRATSSTPATPVATPEDR